MYDSHKQYWAKMFLNAGCRRTLRNDNFMCRFKIATNIKYCLRYALKNTHMWIYVYIYVWYTDTIHIIYNICYVDVSYI